MHRLEDLSFKSVRDLCINANEGVKTLSSRVVLAPPMSEKMLMSLIQDLRLDNPREFNEVISNVFKDSARMPLRHMNFQNAVHLTDKTLIGLMQQNPSVKHLDIQGCRNLTRKCFSAINKAPNLESLVIGSANSGLLPKELKCPSLKSLVIWDWKPRNIEERIYTRLTRNYLNDFLKPVIQGLTYLDLSGCSGVKHLSILGRACHLETLILNDTKFETLLDDILLLAQLRVLDISTSPAGKHSDDFSTRTDATLIKVIESLPNLERLNISGTRFSMTLNTISATSGKPFGIPSSVTREEDPLQFVSLYETLGDACSGNHLPATGSVNQGQLNYDFEHNINRPRTLCHILSNCLKADNLTVQEGLQRLGLLCQLMKNRSMPEHIQNSGLRCLLQVLQVPQMTLDANLKERVFNGLFLVIKDHYLNTKVIQTAYDVLSKIGNPDDSAFNFKQFSEIVMNIDTRSMNLETFSNICRIRGIFSCSADPANIGYLCELQIIEKSVEFIGALHWRYQSDNRINILSSIWTIWETVQVVTQKSLEGRKRFVAVGGMNWLHWYLSWYDEQPRLYRALREIIRGIEKTPGIFEPSEVFRGKLSKNEAKELKKNSKCLRAIQAVFDRREFNCSADNCKMTGDYGDKSVTSSGMNKNPTRSLHFRLPVPQM